MCRTCFFLNHFREAKSNNYAPCFNRIGFVVILSYIEISCRIVYEGYNFSSFDGNKSFTFTMQQKMKFSIRISSVNVTKSAIPCGFGHIY